MQQEGATDVCVPRLIENAVQHLNKAGFFAGAYTVALFQRQQMEAFIHTISTCITEFATKLAAASDRAVVAFTTQEFVMAVINQAAPCLRHWSGAQSRVVMPPEVAQPQFHLMHALLPPSCEYNLYLPKFKDRSYTYWRRKLPAFINTAVKKGNL